MRSRLRRRRTRSDRRSGTVEYSGPRHADGRPDASSLGYTYSDALSMDHAKSDAPTVGYTDPDTPAMDYTDDNSDAAARGYADSPSLAYAAADFNARRHMSGRYLSGNRRLFHLSCGLFMFPYSIPYNRAGDDPSARDAG